jgi:hypothetical protein
LKLENLFSNKKYIKKNKEKKLELNKPSCQVARFGDPNITKFK